MEAKIKSSVKGYNYYRLDNGNYGIQIIWHTTCPECIRMGITEQKSPYYEFTELQLKELFKIKEEQPEWVSK